jgi:prolipoprotein diacylglyceryltransferase
VIGAIFGSILGSRLIGGLEDINALNQSENLFRHFFQNKTVVGGFLGGLMGVEIIKLMIGEKKASGDLFVFPLLLALIIGRLGCFSMGVYEETYGNPSALPWAMDLGDGILRHPVTLYEIVFLLTLWQILRQISAKLPLANGALFKLFMIAYLLFRFLLDFIKPHYTFNMGLSTIQLTCILGLLWYLKYLLRPEKLLAVDSNQN